jgi:hypothetical protein
VAERNAKSGPDVGATAISLALLMVSFAPPESVARAESDRKPRRRLVREATSAMMMSLRMAPRGRGWPLPDYPTEE